MSFRSTILVYEFFSGGGCPASELPAGLAAEALGMLWALLQDFRSWGAVRTVTALDPRFENRVPGLNRTTLPADEVVCANHDGHLDTYLSLLKRCDAVLIIAPETDGVLAKLTAYAEKAGIPLLCSGASAVATAGNKSACGRLFSNANLPIPATRTAGFDTAAMIAQKLGFPLVIKPIDGIGSEGVFLLNSLSDLPIALFRIRQATSRNKILLQSYVSGIHASASILAANDRFLPLSLNRQLMEKGQDFRYLGSEVPFHHKTAVRAMELACSAASLIPGLKGYVGVDLVLTDDLPKLIEINPRLTTSYLALRRVAQVNLAQTIWHACIHGVLPESIPLTGRAKIYKNDPASWKISTPQRREPRPQHPGSPNSISS